MTEANVVLEMRMADPMSLEVLDKNSDDVVEAVEAGAPMALGPAVALNEQDCAIRLRFDVEASDDAEVYRQIAEIVKVIEDRTDLSFVSHGATIEPAISPTTEGDRIPA